MQSFWHASADTSEHHLYRHACLSTLTPYCAEPVPALWRQGAACKAAPTVVAQMSLDEPLQRFGACSSSTRRQQLCGQTPVQLQLLLKAMVKLFRAGPALSKSHCKSSHPAEARLEGAEAAWLQDTPEKLLQTPFSTASAILQLSAFPAVHLLQRGPSHALTLLAKTICTSLSQNGYYIPLKGMYTQC